MNLEKKRFVAAAAVLIGTCIGAGVLGIPYVAAKAGFFTALIYIFVLGGIILLTNLYLGEIALRTKENHQLPGYAQKYLNKFAGSLMEFAVVFGIYAALVAYMFGVGESLSVLFFGNSNFTIIFGVLFGFGMSGLLWRGIKALKRFEKIGVAVVLILLAAIFFIFLPEVHLNNLYGFSLGNIFLPFGVILFALLCFHAVPEARIILHKDEKLFKKVIFTSTIICVIFYALFAFVVVGFKGAETPEIATLALGSVFIILGMFTMFTSYLALGNAFIENLMFDERFKKFKSWILAAIVPIVIFLIIQFWEVFSFTKILSIGGTISGGLIAILILLMIKSAKKNGDRKPEYSVPANWFLIILLCLIFAVGVITDLLFF